MKVLLTTPAGAGHVLQLVPLGQALAAAGHDVLWAMPDRGTKQVEEVGMRVVGVSVPPTHPGEVIQRYPEFRGLSPVEIPEWLFAKMFGATHAPPMLEGLLPVAAEFRPDLIVSDVAELAGPIVAAELGIPHVAKSFGAMLPAIRVERAAVEVAPLWRSRGLEPRPLAGLYDHLYLDIYPPELQQPAAFDLPNRQPMRPITYSGPVDASAPLPLPAGRPGAPLVYVTMGTVFNNPGLFGGIVAGLADLDVRVLVTVGQQGDPDALGAQPDHIRIERYVPQSRVLPQCALVISHGGSGTALATLELGLPQLCLPQGADQFLNAAAITKAGAGLSLAPDDATAEPIRRAARRLLDHPSFRSGAERISASIRAMPTPEEVVPRLEGLVT